MTVPALSLVASTAADAEQLPDLVPQTWVYRVALNVSKPTFGRMKALGRIGPQPIVISTTCLRYSRAEVLAWIAARKPDGTLPTAVEWAAMRAAAARRGGR